MSGLSLNTIFLFLAFFSFAQTTTFKENNKWGIKEKDKVIIKPLYDTIFNFDSTGKVCLACAKARGVHPNKYIKTPVFTYNCNYLNKRGEWLTIKQSGADTTSIFTLLKNTVAQYNGSKNEMTVAVKDKNLIDHRNLVDKDFKQITEKGYEEVRYSKEPAFLIASKRNENNVIFEGLINQKEEEVIPFRYSHIKLNVKDSLIIGCTAGQGANSEDDIFDYTGKKIGSYHRHIELATKKFIVHKVFKPKEYLIIVNLSTKEEKVEYAEEAQYYNETQVLMVNEGHWFTYDINTYKKKSYDIKHKK